MQSIHKISDCRFSAVRAQLIHLQNKISIMTVDANTDFQLSESVTFQSYFRSGLGLFSAAHIFHIPSNQHVTLFTPLTTLLIHHPRAIHVAESSLPSIPHIPTSHPSQILSIITQPSVIPPYSSYVFQIHDTFPVQLLLFSVRMICIVHSGKR